MRAVRTAARFVCASRAAWTRGLLPCFPALTLLPLRNMASASLSTTSTAEVDAATASLLQMLQEQAPPPDAQAVLNFWFNLDSGKSIEMQGWWWHASDEVDAKLRAKFGDLVETALEGGQDP